MKVLLDIGNSRLKCAYTSNEGITFLAPILHSEPDFIGLLSLQWQTLAQIPIQLAISCVGRTKYLQQIIDLAKQLWPEIKISIPKAQAFSLGVSNAYKEPEKLGIDRWLALLAVRQLYQQDACVVDCGTAITIDFMNAEGYHLGGMISPGLTLMKHSLAKNTEQLMFSQSEFTLGLADHTEAAIYNGTLFAAVGLIEKVLQTQSTTFKLFLTGGDAQAIAKQLNNAYCILPELVLQGLLAISDEDNE